MEMSQYLEVFIEESREHIQSLNENVLLGTYPVVKRKCAAT